MIEGKEFIYIAGLVSITAWLCLGVGIGFILLERKIRDMRHARLERLFKRLNG